MALLIRLISLLIGLYFALALLWQLHAGPVDFGLMERKFILASGGVLAWAVLRDLARAKQARREPYKAHKQRWW
ncbi:hypothetical protein Dxin01_00791 [Deinococcus xinjiangensis]|uniref:Uncharacterized protein n=1 Tax=Deinococcus xinjiangensis TaxID=457454 RepID=A0ABP9V6Z9_9DEIO